MRIGIVTITLLLATSVQLLVASPLKSQPIDKVNVQIGLNNETLVQALHKIEAQSPFRFMYRNDEVKNIRNLTVKSSKQSVEDFLKTILAGTSLTYRQMNNQVLIMTVKYGNQNLTASLIPEHKRLEYVPVDNIVKGKITNSRGEPLVGVSVTVKGTTIGTTTDGKGNYSIDVPADGTLVFSFVGFAPKEMAVNGRMSVDLVMEENASTLDQVVVIGYGTKKKSSLTSAISTISSEELTQRPVANGTQMLQGLAPGVTILDRGGGPGESNAKINIRGITTLNNNDPLILVDGIEGDLQDINPNDIESISVLKDAASASIYGSRAANGVILVTTKRAKSGTFHVAYDGYYSLQRSIYHPRHMGLKDFLVLKNVAAVNAGKSPKYSEEEINTWVNSKDRIRYPLPNIWFDYYFSTEPQQNHSFSIEGGTKKTRSKLSINYFKQIGIIPQSWSTKKEVRYNNDFDVSDKITISADIDYRLKEYERPLNEELSFRRLLSGSNFAVPRYPDGTYGLGSENRSPIVENELVGNSNYSVNQLVSNLRAQIEILKGLNFKTQFGAALLEYYQKNFSNSYQIRDFYNPDLVLSSVPISGLKETRNNTKQYTLNNLLEYSKNMNGHNLNILLGYSQIMFQGNNLSASRRGFFNNNIRSINQGSSGSMSNDGQDFGWGLRSYFGRINYNFNNKYFLVLNGRFDGSSRFTADKRYSFFPSFSAGWRVSEEKFWKPLKDGINEFKIRGSLGNSGNQEVDLYSYYQTLVAQDYNFGGVPANGYIQKILANKNISWESTNQFDLGFDIEALKGKLGVTFDYYRRTTNGILLNLPIPLTVGLDAPPQNAGVVQNKGWEVSVNYSNHFSDFNYAVTANISDVRNKILDLHGTGPYIQGNPNEILTIRKVGLPIDSYIGYHVSGIFQSEEEVKNSAVLDPSTTVGDFKYADINGDGVINSKDYVVIGSSIPRYTFGLNLNLSYKGIDIGVFLQGVDKVNGLPSGALREQGNWGGFTIYFQNDYWTPENKDAKYPRPQSETIKNSQMSDFWILNASYLKLKNLQIGYTLPITVTKRFHLEKLRVYASGSNLFTISPVTKWGLDPEFPSGRLNYYPQVSMYTAGLNVSF